MSVAVLPQGVPQSLSWQGSIDPDRNRHAAAVYLATAPKVKHQSVASLQAPQHVQRSHTEMSAVEMVLLVAR